MFQIGEQIDQLTIEHNTAFSQTASTFIWSGDRPLTDCVIKNNIFGGGQYQMFCASLGVSGAAAWDAEAGPGCVFLGNVIALMGESPPAGNWNPGSFGDIGFVGGSGAPYSVTASLADLGLTPSSSYNNQGTDGTDPGADVLSVAGAVSGVGGGF